MLMRCGALVRCDVLMPRQCSALVRCAVLMLVSNHKHANHFKGIIKSIFNAQPDFKQLGDPAMGSWNAKTSRWKCGSRKTLSARIRGNVESGDANM